METARIPHVEGNVLKLAIPLTLQTIIRNNGETSTRIDDYIPSSNYPVWVEFTKGIVKHRLRATMQDNVAFVEDKGKMRYGKYDIAVLCNDDNGDPRKFKQRTVLEVFEYTADAGLPTGVEFNSETHWLDAAVFIAYNGGNFEETDPTVPKCVKDITEEDIENWNTKQDKVLVVSFTVDDGRVPPRISADKTFAEISAAINAGTTVVAKDEEGCFCQLVEYSDSIISFVGAPDYSEHVVSIYTVNDEDRSLVERINFGVDEKLLKCEEFNRNRDMYSYEFPDDTPTPLMAWNFEEEAYFLYDLANESWIRIGEASNGIADISTQQDGIVVFTLSNNDTYSLNLNHTHTNLAQKNGSEDESFTSNLFRVADEGRSGEGVAVTSSFDDSEEVVMLTFSDSYNGYTLNYAFSEDSPADAFIATEEFVREFVNNRLITPIVTNSSSGSVTQNLEPNKFYKFTGALTSLTIGLPLVSSGGLDIFFGKFTAGTGGCTFGYPSSVNPAPSVPSTFEEGKTYEFSIMDNELFIVEA